MTSTGIGRYSYRSDSYIPGMGSPRALHPEQNDRIRERVRAIVAEHGSQVDAAKALKVGRHLITQHLLGKGAGHVLIEALRTYTGESYEQLVDGEGPPSRPERTYAADDRYPNRGRALEAWRLLGRDEEAAKQVASLRMDRDDDPSPDEWFADLEREEARLRREAKSPPVLRVVKDEGEGAPKMPWRK